MECPRCGASVVTFAVPSSFRGAAPAEAEALAICPSCLTLTSIDGSAPSTADAEFTRIIESFPEGDAGAAMAIAVGLLVDSLALHRDTIKELFEVVSDVGEDPWLVLERLAVAGTVQPDADLSKLRHQLDQLWR